MRFRVEFVFLVISLIGYEDQCGLYLGKPMLFDDRVMDIPAIHAAVSVGPHMSVGTLEIQEMFPHHESVAA